MMLDIRGSMFRCGADGWVLCRRSDYMGADDLGGYRKLCASVFGGGSVGCQWRL